MAKASAAKIDRMMEQASEALARRDYFDCERTAVKALAAAYQVRDFERLARIVLPLQEARRQKRLEAADTGRVIRLSEKAPADEPITPACYLIEPMLVGADGRDLRERADQTDTPVLVVVREPETQLGQWPLVMIGPVTVRAKVQPPPNDHVTVEWMLAASETLGDEAIAQVDPAAAADERVDDLIDRLGTCPEHEKLHQRLEEACREAIREREVARAEAAKNGSRTGQHAAGPTTADASDEAVEAE